MITIAKRPGRKTGRAGNRMKRPTAGKPTPSRGNQNGARHPSEAVHGVRHQSQWRSGILHVGVTILFLVTSTATSLASAKKVEVTKANQGDAPIEVSVTITPDEHQKDHVMVKLVLPPGQQELTDLWKVYIWVLKDGKTTLGVPIDVNHGKDQTITVHFHGHIETVSRSLIAIRCGKHAPLNETIYQFNIGSYLKNE